MPCHLWTLAGHKGRRTALMKHGIHLAHLSLPPSSLPTSLPFLLPLSPYPFIPLPSFSPFPFPLPFYLPPSLPPPGLHVVCHPLSRTHKSGDTLSQCGEVSAITCHDRLIELGQYWLTKAAQTVFAISNAVLSACIFIAIILKSRWVNALWLILYNTHTHTFYTYTQHTEGHWRGGSEDHIHTHPLKGPGWRETLRWEPVEGRPL